jgi:6-phosphogluconolactonase
MAGSATFLYIGNAESQDISAFALDTSTGMLHPLATIAVPGPAKPGTTLPLAVSPDRRFLFVALRNEPWSVRSFAIAPSGALTYLGSGPLADNICYISTDKTGRFLFSASYQGAKIAVNPIGPDGIVLPPWQIIDTEPKSHSILVDAANRYALSACLGGDVFYQWRFDAGSGRLSPNEPPSVPVTKKSGPRHFVFHPNGRIVYLLNEHAVTIYVFAYNPGTGTLTQQQVVNALIEGANGKIWAADIHITPDGRFLYASERGSSTLAGFKVDPATGYLTPIGHTPTEKQPRGFAIDPTGRYLYATGQLSTRMSRYSIDCESGKLTKLDEYPVGTNPNWVEIVTLP